MACEISTRQTTTAWHDMLYLISQIYDFTYYVSQPRILMAMARDGLLPSFFSDVNKQTQVPVKSTIVTGICAAALAFAMDVSQLAGMVRNQLSIIYFLYINGHC